MIITKTPLRITFLGSLTDNPKWHSENKGMVIGSSINKYVYCFIRKLSAYEKQKEVTCPYIKNVLNYFKEKSIDCSNFEIAHFCDLPSNSGLGYQSALTVGLLQAIHAISNIYISKKDIANLCNYILQKNLCNFISSADAFLSVYGGQNIVKFNKSDDVLMIPLKIKHDNLQVLLDRIGLYYLNSFDQIDSQPNEMPEIDFKRNMWPLVKIAEDGAEVLLSSFDLEEFFRLIKSSFKARALFFFRMFKKYSSEFFDRCVFSKLLGFDLMNDNGSGCGIIYTDKPISEIHLELLKDYERIPFNFESNGSSIIL